MGAHFFLSESNTEFLQNKTGVKTKYMYLYLNSLLLQSLDLGGAYGRLGAPISAHERPWAPMGVDGCP